MAVWHCVSVTDCVALFEVEFEKALSPSAHRSSEGLERLEQSEADLCVETALEREECDELESGERDGWTKHDCVSSCIAATYDGGGGTAVSTLISVPEA